MGVTLQQHGGDRPGGKALAGQVFSEGGYTFLEEPKGKVESDDTVGEGVSKEGNTVCKVKAMYCLASNLNVGACKPQRATRWGPFQSLL